MKKLILSLAIMGLFTGMVSAADSNFGLGIVLGDPSGISARFATGSANSINVIVGYDANHDYAWHRNECCRDGGMLYVGGDYLWYNYNLIRVSQGRLPLYYGPGINATIANDYSSIGVRGVVGLEYQFANAPFDVFLEIGPGINVIPNTWVNISGGLGARFFF